MPPQQAYGVPSGTQLLNFIPSNIGQADRPKSSSLQNVVDISKLTNSRSSQDSSAAGYSRQPTNTPTAISSVQRTRPKSPMSDHIERGQANRQHQDLRQPPAKRSPFPDAASLNLSVSTTSPQTQQQQREQHRLSMQSTPSAEMPLSPSKQKACALAAVNLLPLARGGSHTQATLSSRPIGIMATGNNTNTSLHSDLLGSRATARPTRDETSGTLKRHGEIPGQDTELLGYPSASSADRQNANRAHLNTNGPGKTDNANASSSSHKNGSNNKPAPIIIIEQLNTGQQPTKMVMAADSQTASTNRVRNNGTTDSAPANSNEANRNRNLVRIKSRPKRKPTPSLSPTPQSAGNSGRKHTGIWHQGRFDTRGSPLSTPFTWDTYLKLMPAKVAPRKAFRQPEKYPQNNFLLGMKLEARDPRNAHSWSLASVVGIEGLHIRLRLEGTDAMNDLYELVDSDNIRPIGSKPGELLLAPTGFKGNIANYTKFVEKTLKDAFIANPDCFPPTPIRPPRNLFEKGMKLEAVDRKNRDLICPATIGEVTGDLVKIAFDGWLGSFDYTCEYYSRDLFPINWCRDVARPVQPPANWTALLEKAQQVATQTLPSTSSIVGDSLSPDFKDRSPTHASDYDSSTSSKASGPRVFAPASKATRGRPRKSAISSRVDASPSKRDTTGVRDNLSSTPKRDLPKTGLNSSDTKQSNSPYDSEETEKASSMCSDIGPSDKVVIEGYECRRTIPYPECLNGRLIQDSSLDGIKSSNLKDNSDTIRSETFKRCSPEANQPLDDEQESSNYNGEESLQQIKRARTVATHNTKHPSTWTVDEVLDLIKSEETLVKYSDVFMDHEIDGKAFMLLTTDILVNHMGLKIGPVLKINDLLERVKRQFDM